MIVFGGEIVKARPTRYDAYRQLNAFLRRKEPRLARFLARFIARNDIITYQDIRLAIMAGELDSGAIERWRDEYSKMIVANLYPEWQTAMQTAAQAIEQRYPEYLFNAGAEGVKEWASNRAAEMVVDITENQRQAINAMVQRYSYIPEISVDQFAQVIRPTVGLYPAQAMANMRYFETVRQSLLNNGSKTATATKKATEAAIKYAERQNRYRAQMIARTELCAAYNQGEYQGIKQAQAQGLIGHVVKQWVSAGDDRVCDTCKALDGTQIEMDQEWANGSKWDRHTPPAHPHCRCVEVFIEV